MNIKHIDSILTFSERIARAWIRHKANLQRKEINNLVETAVRRTLSNNLVFHIVRGLHEIFVKLFGLHIFNNTVLLCFIVVFPSKSGWASNRICVVVYILTILIIFITFWVEFPSKWQ